MKFDPTNPKWTAYALGELDAAERATVEHELSQSTEAQRFIAAIRETAEQLTAEFKIEPATSLSPDQRIAITQELQPKSPRKTLRPSRLWLGFALAASVLLVASTFLLPTMYRAREAARQEQVCYAPLSSSSDQPPLERFAVIEGPIEPPDLTAETTRSAGPPEVMQEEQINSSPDDAFEEAGGGPVAPPSTSLGGLGGFNQTDGASTTRMLPESGKGGKGSGRGSGVRKEMVGRYGGTAPGDRYLPSLDDEAYGDSSGPEPRFSRRQAYGYNRRTGGPLEFPDASTWEKLTKTRATGGRHPSFEDQRSSEAYDSVTDNSFIPVQESPLSTFSIDVDTASYSNIRRFLTQDHSLPPKGAVRIEELINYFRYDYPQPEGDKPFSVTTEVAGCPWNAEHRLVRIGLKGREIAPDKRPPSNLVFLLDVSGSMSDANKLPLVREAMKLLVEQLTENDRVAIVVYAGQSGIVLPSTTGDKQQLIREAIDQLGAGGSTNGAGGIQLAYDVAAGNFVKGGTNRVILATDGDFNVGITDRDQLLTLITEKAKSGVFLTTLGFGMGNLKDGTLEQLADKGNGNYAYIDDMREAKKVFVEQMAGTLITIAKDVKIQIEFNPTKVAAFRLIGYENRVLAHEDFNNDKKDAGEIGAGHTVTALYEIEPVANDAPPAVDPLKYQPAKKPAEQPSDELLTVKLRYKQPDGDTSKLIEAPLKDRGTAYGKATTDFKFAASVALFGMLLRDSPYKGAGTFDVAGELAGEGRGEDVGGYRAEFIELVKQAKALRSR